MHEVEGFANNETHCKRMICKAQNDAAKMNHTSQQSHPLSWNILE